jgi:hypothetical protein
VNNLSFDPNNTGRLQINQIKALFNVEYGKWVGTTLNYDITEEIYKMYYLIILII